GASRHRRLGAPGRWRHPRGAGWRGRTPHHWRWREGRGGSGRVRGHPGRGDVVGLPGPSPSSIVACECSAPAPCRDYQDAREAGGTRMSATRRTIARPVTLEGVGLHLGVPCRLTFRPAPSGQGIRFVRTDRPGTPSIPAVVEHAVLTERRTQLRTGEDAIHTVEHVLAAVAGAEVDDVTIELNGPEPPIMDGSAAPFLNALASAGQSPQQGQAEYLTLRSPIRVVDGESIYEAHPSDTLDLFVSIAFPHPLIGRQQCRYAGTPDVFAREIAPARTFGFVHEVDALRSRGLIRGGSTENAIVLDEAGVVENTLRWPDEFVRHKALDCVGDLGVR